MQHGGLGRAADPLALEAAQLTAVALQADADLRERAHALGGPRRAAPRPPTAATAQDADGCEIRNLSRPPHGRKESLLECFYAHYLRTCLPAIL